MEPMISNVLANYSVKLGRYSYVPFFLAFRNLQPITEGFIVRETLDDRNW